MASTASTCRVNAGQSPAHRPTSGNRRGTLSSVPEPLLVLDPLVGLTFLAVGLATRRAAAAMRAWWAAVGVAWLLGAVPELRVLHQGLLLVALVAFPSGRLSGPARLGFGGVAVLVGVGAGG